MTAHPAPSDQHNERPASAHSADVPLAEAQAELQAVCRSRAFERAERLQDFLRFICARTLAGEGAQINEYLIGVEVFGRGGDYSPSEDSVVRRQAHALRQKLQKHYSAEGATSQVRIELPVGHYVPVFRRQSAPIAANGAPHVPEAALTAVVAPLPAAGASSISSSPRRVKSTWLLGALLVAFFLFLAGWQVGRRAAPNHAATQAAAPALAELWRPWLADGAGATVCFSNPPTAVIKHHAAPLTDGRAATSLIRPGSEDERRVRQYFEFPSSGHVYVWSDRGQGKIGESIGAVYLANFFGQVGLPLRATQSRYLSWENFRREHLILLGHHEINPWVATLLEKYPLRVQADDADASRRIIRNTAPATGEQEKYENVYADTANQAAKIYALISMLPGVDGRHELLLINGLDSPAAHLGAEFLTNPARAEELLARLRAAAPHKQAPWHFQAVLEAEVRDKVPTQGSIVAFRAL